MTEKTKLNVFVVNYEVFAFGGWWKSTFNIIYGNVNLIIL